MRARTFPLLIFSLALYWVNGDEKQHEVSRTKENAVLDNQRSKAVRKQKREAEHGHSSILLEMLHFRRELMAEFRKSEERIMETLDNIKTDTIIMQEKLEKQQQVTDSCSKDMTDLKEQLSNLHLDTLANDVEIKEKFDNLMDDVENKLEKQQEETVAMAKDIADFKMQLSKPYIEEKFEKQEQRMDTLTNDMKELNKKIENVTTDMENKHVKQQSVNDGFTKYMTELKGHISSKDFGEKIEKQQQMIGNLIDGLEEINERFHKINSTMENEIEEIKEKISSYHATQNKSIVLFKNNMEELKTNLKQTITKQSEHIEMQKEQISKYVNQTFAKQKETLDAVTKTVEDIEEKIVNQNASIAEFDESLKSEICDARNISLPPTCTKAGCCLKTSFEYFDVRVPTYIEGHLSLAYKQQLKIWIGGGVNNFQLLYSATRDGCSTLSFHQHCDNHGPTVTVVYQEQYGHVFGGYTSLSWDGHSGYRRDTSAFLFALRLNGTEKRILMPIKTDRTQYAIYSPDFFGPTFGGGHDLMTFMSKCNRESNNFHTKGYMNPNSYTQSDLFQVVKKLKMFTELEVYKVT